MRNAKDEAITRILLCRLKVRNIRYVKITGGLYGLEIKTCFPGRSAAYYL